MFSRLLQNENVLRSNHLFLVQSLNNLKKTIPLPLGSVPVRVHRVFQISRHLSTGKVFWVSIDPADGEPMTRPIYGEILYVQMMQRVSVLMSRPRTIISCSVRVVHPTSP